MPRRLPPLNALRTFLAVAGHLNFTKAAHELNVTPAAVTHQVKALEEYLGVRLLSRTRRRVLLTEAGEQCLPDLREGFNLIGAAMNKADAGRMPGMLTVSVAPAFASKWLIPRLDSFTAAHPDIDVRVSATTSLVDLHDGHTDLAIRFGKGQADGVYVERLLDEHMAPMCAPELLKGAHPIRAPGDLRHHQLIHDISVPAATSRPTWKTWFDLAGVSGGNPLRGLRCSLADLALQAAVNGAGVVLGRVTLARDDIDAGRLVQPFALSIPTDYSYFILIAKPKLRHPAVILFRDWLLAQARKEPQPSRRPRLPATKARAKSVASPPARMRAATHLRREPR
jgi:LysR family glycine cleavage system transcriptional activator